jgi:hypothetical protein
LDGKASIFSFKLIEDASSTAIEPPTVEEPATATSKTNYVGYEYNPDEIKLREIPIEDPHVTMFFGAAAQFVSDNLPQVTSSSLKPEK